MLRLRLLPCAVVALSAAIAVAGCGGGSEGSREPFHPRASLRAVGGTARADKPALVMRVAASPGEAHIHSATVTLPPVVFVDATAIGDLCAKRELHSDRCAGHRRLGFAQVVSPAYPGPLSGPVYAVTGFGGLPHLAYVLGGPGGLLLEGRIVSEGGRIETGVDDVPDKPLKTFELRIDGGRHGFLVLSRDICKAPAVADSTFLSQDGREYRQKVPLRAECGS